MIAYPTHPCDALLESFERDRASSARLPRSLPVRVWGVCAVLLVAGMGVYCVRLEEVSAWPVRASIALPLIVMTVLAMSVATLASLKVSELLDCLKQLTAAIEAEEGEGTGAALSEHGPRAVAELARSINRSARHRAGRQAELLQVLAAYAHDQRTPLTRMGMRCELLDDPAAREALQRDLAELAELVEASLSCARMQCSAGEKTQRVDADDLLGALIGDYQDAGRTVALEGRVGRPVVTCPHALRRVLMNLIDNALRYGGDARLCVRVEARRLVLAVVDSGPGIVPAQMDAVFAPWYRSPETAARAPGSGLGLAIARRLTLAMRGELQLENRRTGGLEARLTLPLVAA
jgi:signal transduction histidine kinase